MSLRLRILLAVLGLTLCLCAVGALVYAWRPIGPESEQMPVAPTLFAPPGAIGLWWLAP